MTQKKDIEIQFRFVAIQVNQFAYVKDIPLIEEKLSVMTNFEFGVDENTQTIQCIFNYNFLSDKKTLIILETAMRFLIEEDCFKKEMFQQEKLTIPRNFAVHMAVTTVGTARGILHEKTKGTPVNKYLIPAINVLDAIKTDITFNPIEIDEK